MPGGNEDVFSDPVPTLSFMQFLRTLTAITINSICLKCYSAVTVAAFQYRWFSLLPALQSHNEIMQARFPYLLFDSALLGWPL